jgi:uncharacterized protein Usg
MNTHDLVRQLTGWRQTTAEILYRMPDHPTLVQTFLWQDLDRWHDDPRQTYPRLRSFCDWWKANLDGPIVQVRVGRPRSSRLEISVTSVRSCAFIKAEQSPGELPKLAMKRQILRVNLMPSNNRQHFRYADEVHRWTGTEGAIVEKNMMVGTKDTAGWQGHWVHHGAGPAD